MDFKRKVNGEGTTDQDDADRAAKRRKLPVVSSRLFNCCACDLIKMQKLGALVVGFKY